MAIKTAGELRQLRGKKSVPLRFKVELTLDEIRLIHLALRIYPVGSPEMGQGSLRLRFANYLRKISVLGQGRVESGDIVYVCASCGIVLVPSRGDVCPECQKPGAA